MTGRSAGLLLHPTSLPGPDGIGDLGEAAHTWLGFLARSKLSLWQVLPLGPTGYGDSPYQAFSAFAGNPCLVSAEPLLADGLLVATDLDDRPRFPERRVDYGAAIAWKLRLLARAHARFSGLRGGALREAYDAFVRDHAAWLDDFALFMALKERLSRAWIDWDEPLARRDPAALAEARVTLAGAIDAQRFRQFAFFRQWQAVRARANQLGVRIMGDVPIFVAYDSADVWARRELFQLDPAGKPTAVAGVPPDYFSPTGQRWGNPLYRWDVLARDGHRWWIERLRAALAFVDVVRLDHFRGFEACWEVPADAPTAATGRWAPGPGRALFDALVAALGPLPIVAEDLGDITPRVLALRDALGFPGMKVLQFAFGGDASDPFLPHHYPRHAVVYTGTHDNDTTRGWYRESSTPRERDHARRYLARDGGDIAWDMIRLAFASVADTAIVPLQDVLDLGSEARMNLPGRESGNWTWRFAAGDLTDAHAGRLAEIAAIYGRDPAGAGA